MILCDWTELAGFAMPRESALAEWRFRREQEAAAKLIKRFVNRRWEQRNPERAAELHRKAAAAWKRRDPAGYRASAARRKKRYRERHPDRVREANRRAYLRWRAKPGNLERARARAAARRQEYERAAD